MALAKRDSGFIFHSVANQVEAKAEVYIVGQISRPQSSRFPHGRGSQQGVVPDEGHPAVPALMVQKHLKGIDGGDQPAGDGRLTRGWDPDISELKDRNLGVAKPGQGSKQAVRFQHGGVVVAEQEEIEPGTDPVQDIRNGPRLPADSLRPAEKQDGAARLPTQRFRQGFRFPPDGLIPGILVDDDLQGTGIIETKQASERAPIQVTTTEIDYGERGGAAFRSFPLITWWPGRFQEKKDRLQEGRDEKKGNEDFEKTLKKENRYGKTFQTTDGG